MSNEFCYNQYWKLPLPNFSEVSSCSDIDEKSESCIDVYCLQSVVPSVAADQLGGIILTQPCPLGTRKWQFYQNQYLSEEGCFRQEPECLSNELSVASNDNGSIIGVEAFGQSSSKCGGHEDTHESKSNHCPQNKITRRRRIRSASNVNNNNSNALHESPPSILENVNSMGNKESRAQKLNEASVSEERGIKKRSRRHRAANGIQYESKQSPVFENGNETQDELTAAINALRSLDPILKFNETEDIKENVPAHNSEKTAVQNVHELAPFSQVGLIQEDGHLSPQINANHCDEMFATTNLKNPNCSEFLNDVMEKEQFSESSVIGWLSEGNENAFAFAKKVSEDLIKSGILVSNQNTKNQVLYSWKETETQRTNSGRILAKEGLHPSLVFDKQMNGSDLSTNKTNEQSSVCDVSCQTSSQTFCVTTQTPSVLNLMKAVQTCFEATTTSHATCQVNMCDSIQSSLSAKEQTHTRPLDKPNCNNVTSPSVAANAIPPSVDTHPTPPPPPPPASIPPPPPPPPLLMKPPPPPLMIKGIPPPPQMSIPIPPPPSVSGTKEDDIKPLKPMKPLYWTKVGKVGNTTEKTLWKCVPSAQLDHSELADLFCRKVTSKDKPAAPKSHTASKKVKPAKLLSTKRSQALGIFISSLHVDVEDIKQAVLKLDTNAVDVESVTAVYELRPQESELTVIRSFLKKQEELSNDEKQPLDKPEDFLARLWEVDHCTERLFCITFMSQFQSDLSYLQNNVSLMDTACTALRQDSIQQLFGVILAIGNYLNAGNRSRGKAVGFGLDVLSKLKDVKGNADNLNLLSYVLRVYIKTFDQNVEIALRKCPVPSTLQMIRAAQVDYDDMNKNFLKLQRDLKVCGRRVDEVNANATIHAEPFASIMDQFLTKATSEVKSLHEKIVKSKEGFDDTLAYFGVKTTKNFGQKDFFDLWIRFCSDVNESWTCQLKEILKAQKESAKQKVDEIRSKSSSVVVRARRRPRSLKSRLSAHIPTDST